MAKKRKPTTAAPAPTPDANEARWQKLAQAEAPPTVEAAATPRAAEPEVSASARTSHTVDRNMLPIRNETKANEIRRYAGRMAAWERLQAIVAAHKGHEAEDLAHVRDCAETACPDEAHVAVRGVREWKRATHHDLKHLMTCIVLPIGPEPVPIERIEDCPTLDISHLLPPKPLTYETEYCCNSRCYPRGTLDAWSSCLSLPARLRMRREMERQAHPNLGKALGCYEGGGASAQRTPESHYMDEGTRWGLHHKVYDPASTPLRDEDSSG